MYSIRNFTSAIILLSALLICISCEPAQEDNAAIRSAISAADEKFMGAFNQSDAASLASFYTENAQLLPSNSDFVTGKQAIQDFWQGAMDMGIKSAKLEIVEVEGMGGTAYEVGKYTLYAEDDKMLDSGKYVVIWKKQEDGQWKLHRDIWNTSMPMPEKEQESE